MSRPQFTITEHPDFEDIHSIQSPNAPHCDNGLEMALAARELARKPIMTNTSGVRPLDNRVLVKPDPVEEVTKGGIIIPNQHKEREEMAQVRGTLIAAGVNAWAEAAATSDAFEAPEPGARVLIAKYGGIVITGDDGADYRIMNDADITAVLEG